jgi:ribosomal protein S18 acetylase RimI-like enzyme
MTIERLSPDDWKRLRDLRLEALRDSPDAFGSTLYEAESRTEADWRAQLDSIATFVAVLKGHDIGMARGAPHDSDPLSAFLLSMWVAPHFRRQRTGRQLVQCVIGWARSAGFSALVLDVADDNLPAIALYSRMGFEPTGATGALPPPREQIREHRRVLMLQPSNAL